MVLNQLINCQLMNPSVRTHPKFIGLCPYRQSPGGAPSTRILTKLAMARVGVMLSMFISMLVMVFGNFLGFQRVTKVVFNRTIFEDALLFVLVFLQGGSRQLYRVALSLGDTDLESFDSLSINSSPTCQGSICQRSKHWVSGSSQHSCHQISSHNSLVLVSHFMAIWG